MIFSLVIAFFLGLFIGCFTGLIPGIHINLVGSILLSGVIFSPEIFSSYQVIVFVVSLSIAHTFLDGIPGIFLGCPNDDSSVSIIPGHHFLLKGEGFSASVYFLQGCVFGLLCFVLIALPLFFVIPKIYLYLSPVMWLVLISSSLFLIFSQGKWFFAFFVFLLSGFLGFSSLNLGLSEPLLPLLGGLFGGSSIIFSLFEDNFVPKQTIVGLDKFFGFSWDSFVKHFEILLISSPLVSFLPGLGSGQAAVIGSSFIDDNREDFMRLIGGVNVLVLGLSFVAIAAISKARTGAAAVILSLVPSFSLNDIYVVLFVSLIAGIICFFVGIFVSKKISSIISVVNYKLVSLLVLALIVFLVLFFCGFLGLLVFSVSSLLGLLTISLGVRRTNLMGCLLIPTIIFYLPF
ncbi:MAG: tripartite tricarboxylate transporter permease [Nanoarchaeota archaeon]